MGQIDYDALAKQHGAVMDYDALAAAHGGTSADFKSSNEKDAEGNAVVDPNTVGTFASHAVQQLNPIPLGQMIPFPKAAGGAGWDAPIQAVKQIGAAQGALFDKAKASYQQGDYLTAARHFVDYLLPLVGPALDKSADSFQQGKYAAGLGDAVGLGMALLGPEGLKNVNVKTPALASASKLTPEEAASNAFAQERGVPLDAATATGSKSLRAAQKRVANTMGGEGTAEALIGKQQQSLARAGGELADEARLSPATPETAGQGIKDALTSKIDAHQALAQQAYQKVEAAAQANNISVPTTGVKQMLTPLYKNLQREAQLTPGAVMGSKATVLNAIDRLMQTGDTLPLMDAENVLSSLKELSRSKEGQLDAMRTPGQAAAGQAVKSLQQAIDTAAIRGGVLKDLQSGRAATAAKFETNAALESLSGSEPVGFFRQMTRPKDASVDVLRQVTKQSPQVAPQIARGYLEDLLGQATERGRFDHADKLYAEWQKLGSETKKILFPQPGQRAALDNFFLLAKRVAENPNPSGTAHTLTALNVGSQPLAYALAKLLYTPNGVQTLTRGLSLSLSGQKAAAALQFTRAADLVQGSERGMALPQVAPAGADRGAGADQR